MLSDIKQFKNDIQLKAQWARVAFKQTTRELSRSAEFYKAAAFAAVTTPPALTILLGNMPASGIIQTLAGAGFIWSSVRLGKELRRGFKDATAEPVYKPQFVSSGNKFDNMPHVVSLENKRNNGLTKQKEPPPAGTEAVILPFRTKISQNGL